MLTILQYLQQIDITLAGSAGALSITDTKNRPQNLLKPTDGATAVPVAAGAGTPAVATASIVPPTIYKLFGTL